MSEPCRRHAPYARRGTGVWVIFAATAMAFIAIVGYLSHRRGGVALHAMSREHRLRCTHTVALSAVAEARREVVGMSNDPSSNLYRNLRTAGADVPPMTIVPSATHDLFGTAGAGMPAVEVEPVRVEFTALSSGAGGAWGGDLICSFVVVCRGVARTFRYRTSYYLTAVPGGEYPAEVRLSRAAIGEFVPGRSAL